MGKRIVKNYPSPRLMETIGATNQSPKEAIGELVANCFDARYKTEKLNITIDLRNNKIIVLDNGKGMNSKVLEKAVCIAEDMSLHIDRGEGAKGHFGMGFKTSCSTLGLYYEIYTRPVGDDLEYYTAFDITEYSKRPSGSDAWDVIIEDRKPSPYTPLKNAVHGTAFVISRLKVQNLPVSAILEYMGDAFKGHIENGDTITIIDDNGSHSAIPRTYAFLKGTKVKIDEWFGPNNKYHVTGWVAIDTKTHNDGFYGFNIYRKGQLVDTHNKDWFRAHLMTSRIIGEVNMDFLDATFYKQGIQHSEDWNYVSSYMTEYLKGVVSASYDLSRKGNIDKPKERKEIISRLDLNYDVEHEDESSFTYMSEEVNNNNSKPAISINNTVKSIVSEKSLTLEDGSEIIITFLEKEEDGHAVGPYDYVYNQWQNPQELEVIVYKNHPLWHKKIDSDVRRIIATSDSIYRMLIEQENTEWRKALYIRNTWVSQQTENM